MGMFSELLNEHAPAPKDMVQEDTIGTALRKGFTSGMYGAGSQLQSVAGMAGELAGADEFAQARYGDANALRQQAAQAAPQIQKWDQVDGIGNFGRYAAGVVGGSAPVTLAAMGAGMLTGGGALPAMAAAGAATAPFEIGDTIQMQQADPEAMQQPLADRATGAILGGGASAAFQGIVPGIVGKQLLGHGAAAAAKQGWKGVIGKNIVGDAALEAGAEGGGDVLKQTGANPDAAIDWESVKEKAIGGAVGGGAMGTMGAGADLAFRNVPMAGNAISNAYQAAQAKLKQGQGLAGEQLDKAGETDTWKFVSSIADTGMKMASKTWDAASDVAKAMQPGMVERGEKVAAFLKEKAETQEAKIKTWHDDLMASDDVPGELKQQAKDMLAATPGAARSAWFASVDALKAVKKKVDDYDPVGKLRTALQPEEGDARIKAMAEGKPSDLTNEQLGADGQKLNDEEDVKTLGSRVQELLARATSPEARSSIEETWKNATNSPAARRILAGMVTTLDTTKKKAKGLAEVGGKWLEDHLPSRDDGTKQSADFRGGEKVIGEVVTPWLRKNSPDTLDDDKTMRGIGAGFHKLLKHTYEEGNKPVPTDLANDMFQHFGDDTLSILGQLHTAMKNTDPAAVKNHFTAMTQLAQDQQAYTSLSNLIGETLVEIKQKNPAKATDLDPRALATHLLTWAKKGSGSMGKNSEKDEVANAKSLFHATMINDMMNKTFGSRAKAIMKAVEAEAKRTREVYGEQANISKMDAYDESSDDETLPDYGGEQTDGEWHPPQEHGSERVYYGRGARTNSTPVRNPKLFNAKAGHDGRDFGMEALQRAKTNHPNTSEGWNRGKVGWDVNWKSEHELGMGEGRKTHGYVVAEKPVTEDNFTEHDYRAMKWNTKEYGGKKGDANPSRLRLGTDLDIDATKIERAGMAHMERHGTKRDDNAEVARNQALAHGVAQLMIEHPTVKDADGKIVTQGFKIPDSAVVRYVDKKPVTFGEIKNLGKTTKESRESTKEQELKAQISEIEVKLFADVNTALDKAGWPKDKKNPARREQFNEMVSAKDWRGAYGLDELDMRLQDIQGVLKGAERRTNESQDYQTQVYERGPDAPVVRSRDKRFGPSPQGRFPDAETTITDNGEGIDTEMTQDADPRGQIHQAASRMSADQLRVTVNEDGSPRYVQTRKTYGRPDEMTERTRIAVLDKANELLARGKDRAYSFDNDGYVANKGELPVNPKPAAPREKPKVGFKLTTTGKYTAKDQHKANRATAFIGSGSKASSTEQYAQDAREQGVPVNPGKYHPDDVVFISAEGLRKGRLAPDFDEIQAAMTAGAKILTDSKFSGRLSDHNVGERAVAEYLENNGYIETKPGMWVPANTTATPAKLGFMTVDHMVENEGSAFLHGHAMAALLEHYDQMNPAEQHRLGAAAKDKLTGMAITNLLQPLVKKYVPGFTPPPMPDGSFQRAPVQPKPEVGEDGKVVKVPKAPARPAPFVDGKAAPAPRRPSPSAPGTQAGDGSQRAPVVDPGTAPMRSKTDLPTGPVRRAPSPKAGAAKKAALVKAASSSDPALLAEIAASTDAASLVRSADALLESRIGAIVAKNFAAYGDEYNGAVDALTTMLSSPLPLTKERARALPAIQKLLDVVTAGRLKGDHDAIRVLNAYVQAENQIFGLRDIPDLNKALVAQLNKVKVSTLQDYLTIIANAPGVPLAFKQTARAVMSVAGEAKVRYGDTGEANGMYDPATHEVTINKSMTNRLHMLILHEGTHAATIKALTNNAELTAAARELMDHAAKHDTRLAAAYGMKNTPEFMAEGLANPALQKQLMMIPASKNVEKYLGRTLANAWDGFVGLVRKALGLKPGQDSALDQFLQLAARAMKETSLYADKRMDENEQRQYTGQLVVGPTEHTTTLRELQKLVGNEQRIDALAKRAHAMGGVTAGIQLHAETIREWLKRNPEAAADDATVDRALAALENEDSEHSAFPSSVGTTLDAIGERLGTLVQDESQAYNVQRKYSLESVGAAKDRAYDDFASILDDAGMGAYSQEPYPGAKKTDDGLWLSRDGKFTVSPMGGYGWEVVPLDTARFVAEHGIGSAHPNRFVSEMFEKAREGEDLAPTKAKLEKELVEVFGGEDTENLAEAREVIEGIASAAEQYFEPTARLQRQRKRKYSLQSTRIHEDLGRKGFAATHDSPYRFDSEFNWRANSGRGEAGLKDGIPEDTKSGTSRLAGAGTYLSTSEGSHRSYKEGFTARVAAEPGNDRRYRGDKSATYEVSVDIKPEELLDWNERMSEQSELVQKALGLDVDPDSFSMAKFHKNDALMEKYFAAFEAALGERAGFAHGQKLLEQAEISGVTGALNNWREMTGPLAKTYRDAADVFELFQKELPTSDTRVFKGKEIPASEHTIKEIEKQLLYSEKNKYGEPVEYGLVAGNRVEVSTAKQFSGGVIVRASVKGDKYMPGFHGEFKSREGAISAIAAHIDTTRFKNVMASDPRGEMLYTLLTKQLGSEAKASNHLQSLGILGNVHDAQGGTQTEFRNYVIYDDSKITTNYVHFSAATAQSTGMDPDAFAAASEYLDRAVPWVRQQVADLMHAGDYTESLNLIRLSKHALNPQSTAYHESMHAFIADLMQHGHADVVTVLQNLANSPTVLAQMKTFFRNEIGVLRQLKNDPEERVAVMYQMWAAGELKVAPKAAGIFARIKQLISKLLGHWTNDEHALHIMEYLDSGKYAGNRMDVNAVYTALMAKGQAQAWARTKEFIKPLRDIADSLFGAGSENLRDTGIPSLVKLANMVKKRHIDEGEDSGFIRAAREAHTSYANRLGALVEKASERTKNEALRALQNGVPANTVQAEALRVGIRKLLDDMHGYLNKAGVNTADLGVGKDYFPRHWDADYLTRHKKEFMDMARAYPTWVNAEETYQRLVGDMGSEMPTVDRPGMAANKQRTLAFISHADAAPFMEKDLLQIMNSYLVQATRRAEWARRFQDDNSGLERLLDQARMEGATTKQVDMALKFVEGVNGSLGDDLNPTARRIMGDMIVYQNIRLLPLAIFSSVVDPMGILVNGGAIKDAWGTFKRAVSEIPKGLRGDMRADEMTRLAEDLDVITKASLQHALGTSYNQGMVGKTGQKINDAFFRFNMMEQWNTSVRVGATQAALGFLKKHAAGHNQHSARYMKELGLNASDVKVVNGKVATSVAEGLSEAQAARVKSAVNQWVDGAHLRPDAADAATWMNDPHFMLISHLKKFVFAFHHTIIKRVIHETKNGNYAPAAALTSYIPIMLAADLTKGLLQGGGEVPEWKKNWTAADYLMNATERAGVFGVGQFAVEAAHGNWGALTGPTLEQLGDAVSVMGGRESMRSFALHSMPANALYATWAKAGKNDTFDNPE